MRSKCNGIEAPRRVGRGAFSTGLSACLFGIASCGGGNFEIPQTVADRGGSRVEAAQVVRGGIHVPANDPFNVVYPHSREDAAGRAEATANASGTALCHATCDGAGAAESGFQLGYKFDLGRGRAVDVMATLTVRGECRVNSTDADARSSIATELWVFVKDTRGAVLHKETLLGDAEGALRRGVNIHTSFPLTLAPETGYYVILSGRVQASAAQKQRMDAALEIASASIDIVPRSAAASHPGGTP